MPTFADNELQSWLALIDATVHRVTFIEVHPVAFTLDVTREFTKVHDRYNYEDLSSASFLLALSML